MWNGSTMKKVVYILILVMFCSLAAAVVLYIADGGTSSFMKGISTPSGGNGGNVTRADGASLDEEKQESLEGLEDINIQDISENIHIIAGDAPDTVKAHLYGNYTSSDSSYKPTLEMEKNGSTLNINVVYPKKLAISFQSDVKLDVYIPAAYSKNLRVSTTSADTRADSMNLKGFVYNTISGELDFKSLQSGKTELRTTSGDCNISGSLGSFSFHSISGALESDSFLAETSTISVTSGDISLSGDPGKVSFKSVSGALKLDLSGTPVRDLSANCTSGDVTLSLASGSEFGIDFSSVSGEAKCDFPLTLDGGAKDHSLKAKVGNGGGSIKVNSISGDLTIAKK